MKKLTLGFSPCPNDCFIFDAMVHGKIDTENLQFEVVIDDVEELNKRTLNHPLDDEKKKRLDITKLSFAAYPYAVKHYVLLNSGSALGFGVGPILISKIKNQKSKIKNQKIAIPGKYTTANFLLSLAFSDAINKVEMVFSEIENAVLHREVDAGVIIHESRFTYEKKGLKKIIDLGEWWEKETKLPIPLGGIAIKRNFSDKMKQTVNRIIKRSIEFAFSNPESSLTFVRLNAKEMSEDVMYKHIDLYVNKFSVDLGKVGKSAVETMFKKATEVGAISKMNREIFLTNSSLFERTEI